VAGIGFQLERLGHRGGIGGIANAAVSGAVISSGPWLLTIVAVLLLQHWTRVHMLADGAVIQTIIVYAFCGSVVIAAPLSMISVRLASDRLFASDGDSVPGILLVALTWATMPALVVGTMVFGGIAQLSPKVTFLATAFLTLLTHLTIAAPFLTATKRHGPILIGYVGGIAFSALLIALIGSKDITALLVMLCAGLGFTLLFVVAAIRREFPCAPSWPKDLDASVRRMMHVGLAGLTYSLAAWVDKWLLWWSPASAETVGALRLNAINDQASFLGLLTIIPALTLILIVSETRLERAFSSLMIRSTGTSKLGRIEEARRDVAQAIRENLRLLIAMQAVIAATCWVLGPEILRVLGADARGIFAFRLTVVGVIFHSVAIYSTIVLSYYDLFGRIVAIWSLFIAVSIAGTLASWDLGFASFGWGYMAGAVAGSALAIAFVAEATIRLIYLVFVGNNPAVVGEPRYWI
jgi:uncharacterized membrane protein